MKGLQYGTLILAGVLTTLVSCEKNEQVFDQDVNVAQNAQSGLLLPNTLVSESEYNSRARVAADGVDYGDFEAFAKILASATGSADFREALKEEALKKFDGDYDVLYENIRSKTVKGKQVAAYLDKGETVKQAAIENILRKNPLLNISIPLHSEKWNTSKHSLLVAAMDSEDSPILKAFDSQGKVYYLKHDIEPDVPVIVVGYNERMAFDNGKYTRKDFVELDLIQSPIGGGKSGRTMSCSAPYRNNNNYEYLSAMKFMDLGQYESWTRGAPEVKCRVYAPQSADNFSSLAEIANTGLMEPRKRYMINNEWWGNLNVPLFYWDNPNKATSMLFNFWEIDDTGTTHTFTIGLGYKFKYKIGGVEAEAGPSLSYSFQYKATDKEVGKFLVEQFLCPPVNDDYNAYQLGTAFRWVSGSQPY